MPGSRPVVAVFAAYAMLIVLVCPSIPTPIYVHKDKAVGSQAAVSVPALCARPLICLVLLRLIAVSEEKVEQRSGALVDLTCQRLC